MWGTAEGGSSMYFIVVIPYSEFVPRLILHLLI